MVFRDVGFRSGVPKLVGWALAVLTSMFLIGAAAAGSASADENVNFSLDEGTIQLTNTWAKIVDQSLTPPDKPATLSANVATDGTLTAPKSAFTFPPKKIEDLATGNSLLPMVDAKIAIAANNQITGSFNLATGVASVSVPTLATITVYEAGSPASVAKCQVSGFALNLATTGQLVDPGSTVAPERPAHTYQSAAFAPPSGEGAMVATWTGLPKSVDAGGSLGSVVCPAVDGLIGGAGGLWLSGTAGTGAVPAGDAPTKAPDITTAPQSGTEDTAASFAFEAGEDETSPVTGFQCSLDSAAFAACDGGTVSYTNLAAGNHKFSVKATNKDGQGPVADYTWEITKKVTPPPPGKAKLGGLKISPKTKTVKRGKKTVVKVTVKNVGNASATGVKVCVNAPKKLVRVKKCVNLGAVAAGKAKTAKFTVTVSKKAKKGKKAVLKFKATAKNAAAKTGKATVKVK